MTRPSHESGPSPQRLRHIRWIGGGSGAGKSTVARHLTEACGLRRYQCDDTQAAPAARSNPVDHPMLHGFMAMTMDERWVKRTPEEMYRAADPDSGVEAYRLFPARIAMEHRRAH